MNEMLNSGQWLDDLLNELNWSAADLSRATGLASAVISNIRTGKRGTGLDVAKKIAKATMRPEGDIMRRAGILPPVKEKEELSEKILHDLSMLLPEEQRDVLEFIEFKARKKKA